MSYMQKLETMATSFPGRSVRFRWHLGPPALSLQSRSHWFQPFITGHSQRPFKFQKKEREIWKEQDRERERERVQRRGHEECFCCPERLSPVSAVKKCYWWRVQMLKEGMIANKRGQKTRVGSAVTAALLLCVFTTTMSATLSKPLLYFNFSVHYKHNHWGMMLQWRALSHSTSPVQRTVRHWDASLNWLQRFWCSCDWSCAVFGCFLAALDGRMIDEDYQVLLSDGQAFAQLWVLGSEHPPAGGKQKISHCFLELCCRNTDRFYRPRV